MVVSVWEVTGKVTVVLGKVITLPILLDLKNQISHDVSKKETDH